MTVQINPFEMIHASTAENSESRLTGIAAIIVDSQCVAGHAHGQTIRFGLGQVETVVIAMPSEIGFNGAVLWYDVKHAAPHIGGGYICIIA